MPWRIGLGAPAGEWVPLPMAYGGSVWGKWTKGKGEGGLRLKVGKEGKEREAGSVGPKGYRHFRWSRDGAQQKVRAGRILAWLREGRCLDDEAWVAHHVSKTGTGGPHRKTGGVVRSVAKSAHAAAHGAEGGATKALKVLDKKGRAAAKVLLMNKARTG